MAPREVNTSEFPDTLPEDFAEWDGGEQQAPAAPPPVKEPPVERVRPVETRPPAAARVVVNNLEVERPMPTSVVRPAKAAAPAAPQAPVEKTWQPAPRPKQTSSSAPKVDRAPSSSQRAAEAKLAEALWPADQKKKAKTQPVSGGHRAMAIALGAVVCVGLGAGFGLYLWRSHSQPQQPATAETTTIKVPEPGVPADMKPDPRNATPGKNGILPGQTPSSSTQQTSAQGTSTQAQQQAADNTPATPQPANPTPNVNMSQFTAASSIPHNQQGGNAPEPGNIDMSRMGGGSGPVFGSSNQGHVQFAPSKPIEVASGVLSPTLIKKTTPEYPPIARNMHVSGVVTVAITITPQGTVAEAHAISGPILLRQSAVDAVKNWRFRPYLVNNRPVAVETDVNVDFALQ